MVSSSILTGRRAVSSPVNDYRERILVRDCSLMNGQPDAFHDLRAALTGVSTRKRSLIVWCVGAIGFAWVITNSWRATPDSALYLALAESLAAGAGYRFNGDLHTYVPPGYPAVLCVWVWLFGASFLGYRVLMSLVGLATATAGWWFVRRVYGRDVGWCVGGLFALNHVLLVNATYTTSDVPFALVTFLGLTAVAAAMEPAPSRARLLLAGLLLGLPALVRINGWGIPPAVAVYVLWHSGWKTRIDGWLWTGLFLFASMVPAAAWEWYKSSFPVSFHEGTYVAAVTGRMVATLVSIMLQSLWDYVAEIQFALTGLSIKTGILECLVPLLAVVGLLKALARRERLLVPITVIQFLGLFLAPAGSRYLIHLIPALYLFLGLGLLSVARTLLRFVPALTDRIPTPRSLLIGLFVTLGACNVGHNVATIIQTQMVVESGGAQSDRDLPFFAAGRWLRNDATPGPVLSMHPRILHYLSGRRTVELTRSGVPEHEAWVNAEESIRRLVVNEKPAFLFSDARSAELFDQVLQVLKGLGLSIEEIPEARATERFRLWRIVPARPF